MKLLIVAGGGGHFAAATAVIEAMPKDWEILLVGRKYAFEADKTISLEYQIAQQKGIPFKTLTTGRLQRKFSRHTLISLFKIPVGFAQALKLLKEYKPDVIVSFGGYVSLPVAQAGRVLRIPIIVHEQIMGAGLANKITGKFAKKVCISWESSAKYFPKDKVVLTGLPLKSNTLKSVIARSPKDDAAISTGLLRSHPCQAGGLLTSAARNDKTIFITGGSSGSHAINRLIEGCLEKLLARAQVFHQTGDAKEFGDYDRLERLRTSLPKHLQDRYTLMKFLDPTEFSALLRQADLVVSRSGINTVAEILSLGKPSFFVPLPFGQHNEQRTNANYVKQIGLAEIAEQQSITSDMLRDKIFAMLDTLASYQKHADEAKKHIRPDAAARIVEVIQDVTKKNSQ